MSHNEQDVERVAKALGKGKLDHEKPVFAGVALHDNQASAIARVAITAYESARGDVSVAPEHWTPSERAAYDCGVIDGRNEKPCARCGGLTGNHGFVHLRHGNGGGSNSPCPNAPEPHVVTSVEDDPIPWAAQVDIWTALYNSRAGFEEYRDEHGLTDTWEHLRERVADLTLGIAPGPAPREASTVTVEEATTDVELYALPKGTVVMSASGTIACRSDGGYGVVFGDERRFAWSMLALPVRVLYRAAGINVKAGGE